MMHHPNKFHQTENYGSSRAAAAAGSGGGCSRLARWQQQCVVAITPCWVCALQTPRKQTYGVFQINCCRSRARGASGQQQRFIRCEHSRELLLLAPCVAFGRIILRFICYKCLSNGSSAGVATATAAVAAAAGCSTYAQLRGVLHPNRSSCSHTSRLRLLICLAFPTRQAGTGTWLGAAPRGAANPEQAAAAAAKAAAAVREPSTVLLSTGQHMPLIGLGTYKLQSAGAVTTALELGYRHFDCECV